MVLQYYSDNKIKHSVNTIKIKKTMNDTILVIRLILVRLEKPSLILKQQLNLINVLQIISPVSKFNIIRLKKPLRFIPGPHVRLILNEHRCDLHSLLD